jgi:hypothetical protein
MDENSEKLVNLISQRLDRTSKYYVENENIEVVRVEGCRGAGMRQVDHIHLPMWVINLKLPREMKIRSNDV